ncbi:uncharacterized protein LOC125316303 [Rhodamnia argentea]|uniref:Uncharacterized protein LOC125316303 n=1 Tax=Rhodamnia argentea TaxID=178133 RepID=A0ABM3HUJ6_9MYRT|nr:uncharacterized protein LOC125316303 [Rhodamnia argentea]
MSKKLSWVPGPPAGAASSAKVPSGEGGYVRGMVTYMAMDGLVMKPMSSISCITLLNRYNAHEIGDLQEKVIDFGMDEAIKLLSASLHSKTVLTDRFNRGRSQVKCYSSISKTLHSYWPAGVVCSCYFVKC